MGYKCRTCALSVVCAVCILLVSVSGDTAVFIVGSADKLCDDTMLSAAPWCTVLALNRAAMGVDGRLVGIAESVRSLCVFLFKPRNNDNKKVIIIIKQWKIRYETL